MTMPVQPAYQGGNGGFGWGGDWSSWIILFLIFGLFGGWGGYGGFGGGNGVNGPGFQGYATRADINEGFALKDVYKRQLRGRGGRGQHHLRLRGRLGFHLQGLSLIHI